MTTATPTHTPRKKRRIFMWVTLAIQGLFAFWIVGGLINASSSNTCATEACETGAAVGTGIGVFIIVLAWFFVNAFLLTGYGLYRLAAKR